PECEEAFEALAREYKAVFWDWYGIMGGMGSMAAWQQAGLAQSDKIHFTTEGYRLLGDMLFEALMDYYNASSVISSGAKGGVEKSQTSVK
ncbi:MAG: hypothetical protein J5519_04285, partial [Bacteroidales bacterium]|nr:hypothetical protein [Bacteroidales bacterium]